MGRPRKIKSISDEEAIELAEELEEVIEGELVEETKSKFPNPGVDIAALVKSAKGRYSRGKKQGLANDLTTGDKIILSEETDDYVILSEGRDEFWRPLSGIKGIPFGRIVQIAGKPDSGKSTTAMVFMKAAQEAGVLVILWDSEKKFSTSRYENRIGGDASIIPLSRNKQIVEGTKQIVSYVKDAKAQNPDVKILIVWDSVGATLNTAEDIENDDHTKQPGVTAREISWAIKRLNQLIERYRNTETGKETVAVLCINQVYDNIGSVGTKQKGGKELEYLSSIILELSRKKTLKRQVQGVKKKYGIVARANVVKNHLFDGEDCVAELDIVVSANGIQLAADIKDANIEGLDDPDED
jgi:RecA/RadA recombinase